MQVSQPINPVYSSRVQQPFQSYPQPLFLSSSRPQPLFTSTPPPQYAPFATLPPQQAFPIDASFQPRIIDLGPASTYSPLSQPLIYSQHPQQVVLPFGQAYLHPQYLVQPAPIVRRLPPQQEVVDNSEALKLCEVKMVESTIFCVVCGAEYKLSEKDQHIQKHVRKGHEPTISQETLKRLQKYHQKVQSKQNLLVKPIVEPEQVDMQYDPNVFQVIQEIIYEDESFLSKKDAGIGQEANNSFSYFDNNVSISHNQPQNIPTVFDTQPNPYFSRQEQQHQYIIPEITIPEPMIKLIEQQAIDPKDHPIIYSDEPVIYQERKQNITSKDQPIIYSNEPSIQIPKEKTSANAPAPTVPMANSLNTYAPVEVNNLIEQHENNRLKSQNKPKQAKSSAVPSPQPLEKESKPASGRFDSVEIKGFPEEPAPRLEQIQNFLQESFSGPFQIKSSNEQSKKSTEVNVSQFIRDLNAQNQSLVIEDRQRIANQSEW